MVEFGIIKPRKTLDTIDLGGGLSWSLSHNAHMSITGLTGSGKTYFIYYLLLAVIRLTHAIVYIADGKAGSLSSFSKAYDNGKGADYVATTPDRFLSILKKITEVMQQRFEQLRNPELDIEMTSAGLGLGEIFLFVDELSAMMIQARSQDKEAKATNKLLNREEKHLTKSENIAEQIIAHLQEIVFLGRQANVHLITSQQVFSAEVLGSSDIRQQLSIRVLLGRPSLEAIQMYGFSKADMPRIDYRELGSGVIWIDGSGWSTPKPYYTPTLRLSKDPRAIFAEVMANREQEERIKLGATGTDSDEAINSPTQLSHSQEPSKYG